MQVNYLAKYLKYKQKYLDLKEEMVSVGGVKCSDKLPMQVKVRKKGFDTVEDFLYNVTNCKDTELNSRLQTSRVAEACAYCGQEWRK
jgi:hypothetical protein